MRRTVWLFLFFVRDICAQYAFFRPKHPCSVVLEEMRFAGYLTRDCTYMDPFVYWRIEHLMSWQGARSACQQIPGADLVSVHNFNEKQTVNAMAQNNFVDFEDQSAEWRGLNQGVWIGLFDESKDGKNWKWSDDSVLDYEDWLSQQPDNQGNKEHCVQTVSFIRRDTSGSVAFGWNDVSCRRGMKAICKVPRIAVFP